MQLKRMDKGALNSFLDRLIEAGEVVGVKERRAGEYVFDKLDSAAEFATDYVGSLLPPHKYLMPGRETLVRFGMDGAAQAQVESEDRIVFGVRPCDLHAIQIMDRVFSDDHPDANYLAKRERTTLVGFDCMAPCDQACFCRDVGSLDVASGFDLLFTDLGDAFWITVGSKKGEALLNAAHVTDAGERDSAALKTARRERRKRFPKKLDTDVYNLPLLLSGAQKSALWKKTGDKCLSCGSCTMVCPTCYCFDVQDVVDLDLAGGDRVRVWDSCQLNDFAQVAGGESFRAARSDRVRHRINRKFLYLMNKYERPVCVGCGRCARVCLAKIKPTEIVNDLVAESGA
ncbi:MAG: 4Fe-4S dicluster domain-containing protein [Candidatus Latescibacterota bacterium]